MHKLCVISTLDTQNNKPESAVVAFAEKDDLSLIFGTSSTTRKYKNLQTNKNISVVIGWSEEMGTLQYEGIARELSDQEAKQNAEILILKNKQSEKFLSKADQRYFLITPKWIRLTTTPELGGIFEVNLPRPR